MSGVTFDTGGLLAIENGRYEITAYVKKVLDQGDSIAIPAPVLAQAWRDGSTQVRLVRFLALKGVDIVSFTPETARRVGEICRQTRASDVVDVSAVWCARKHRHAAIVTSNPVDLRKIDQRIKLIEV